MAESLFQNDDDEISREVERRLRSLQQDPEEMLRRFDRNGDGVLDAEERRAIRDVLRREVESQHRDEPGEVVGGRYRVVARIGRGAQGHTRLAVELETDEFVALKEVDFAGLSGWDAVETFEREVAVLGGLEHSGIPRMRESFRIEGDDEIRLIMVQDFVEGDNLEVKLREGTLFDEGRLRRYAEQLLDILSYLHQHSPPVIHRDIKPANVIERPDGDLALVDFGAAQGNQSGIAVIGTNGYMAPEQLMGRAYTGAPWATSRPALGATIIHLATRKHPSDMGKGLGLDWRRHASLSDSFARWLDRCITPVPDDRFPSAMAAQAAGRRFFGAAEDVEAESSSGALGDAKSRDSGPNVPQSLMRNRPTDCTLQVYETDGTLTVSLPAVGFGFVEVAVVVTLFSIFAIVVFFTAGGSLEAFPLVLVFLVALAFQFLKNPVETFECSPKGITLRRARGGTIKRYPLAQIEGTSTRTYDKNEELRLHLRGSSDLTLATSMRRQDVQWLQQVVQRYLLEQRMRGDQ